MNVIYSERAKQSGDRFALLQQATKKLEEIVGRSSARVQAQWDRTEDAKGPRYTLQIADEPDSAETSFAPDELEPSYYSQIRLHRLWGELLQARSERLLRDLNKDEE